LAFGHRGSLYATCPPERRLRGGRIREVGAAAFAFGHTPVWFGSSAAASLAETSPRRLFMRELVARTQLAVYEASRRLLGPSARRGQGTVEYVGLILLVALLMVGMVAAMKGFQGKQGLELAQTIVDKIREAVGQVTFK
jgi:hypothetical protein